MMASAIKSEGEQLADVMAKMSALLKFPGASPQDVYDRIQSLSLELNPKTVEVDDRSLDTWIARLSGLTGRIPAAVEVPGYDPAAAAWSYWKDTLSGAPRLANEETLVAFIRGAGPFAPGNIKFPIEQMTLRDWSGLFYRAVMPADAKDASRLPGWVAMAALQELGWGHQVATSPLMRESAFLNALAEAERPEVAGWTVPLQQQIECPGILLVSGEGSLSESWTREGQIPGLPPTTSPAALVLRAEELDGLSVTFGDVFESILAALGYRFIVLDASAVRDTPNSARKRAQALEFVSAPMMKMLESVKPQPLVAVVVRRATAGIPAGWPTIVDPTGFRDLYASLVLLLTAPVRG